MKIKLSSILIAFAITAAISSCKKEDAAKSTSMSGFMTNSETSNSQKLLEDSSAYDSTVTSINLEVTKIVLKYEGKDDSTIFLTQSQNIDLLKLTVDSNKKLIEGTPALGDLKEIRLVLGENTYVIKDSVKYDLKVPSGQSSGLKIKMKGKINEGDNVQFKLDFKVRASLKKNKDQFILRPVVKVIIVSGSLETEDLDGTE